MWGETCEQGTRCGAGQQKKNSPCRELLCCCCVVVAAAIATVKLLSLSNSESGGEEVSDLLHLQCCGVQRGAVLSNEGDGCGCCRCCCCCAPPLCLTGRSCPAAARLRQKVLAQHISQLKLLHAMTFVKVIASKHKVCAFMPPLTHNTFQSWLTLQHLVQTIFACGANVGHAPRAAMSCTPTPHDAPQTPASPLKSGQRAMCHNLQLREGPTYLL